VKEEKAVIHWRERKEDRVRKQRLPPTDEEKSDARAMARAIKISKPQCWKEGSNEGGSARIDRRKEGYTNTKHSKKQYFHILEYQLLTLMHIST
jgi:hypothetical protein